MTLNIRHGNGASVVVRGRESRLHGEGRQDVNQFIKRKGAGGIMRSPENVLESLKSKAGNKSYKYERLYRNLYNPQFYLLAYQRIQAKPGNMTAGTDGKTIDGMGMARINALIEKMRDIRYQPNPVRRTYIPKSNGKMRPRGIP